MPVTDNDVAIRDRAYDLWERAGCPLGREHEHWAQARREIETETAASQLTPSAKTTASQETVSGDVEFQEIIRLRQALYAPEPFSFELFGAECPRIDRSIVLNSVRAAGMPMQAGDSRRAA